MKGPTARVKRARSLCARNPGWLKQLLVAGQLLATLMVCITLVQEALSLQNPITLEVPSFWGPDAGEVIAFDENGDKRWVQQWSQTVKETESGTIVSFRESGEGIHSPFEEVVRWEVNSTWESSPRFRPCEMDREFYGLDDELLQKESLVLNWDRGIAEFIRTFPGQDSSERTTFEIPPDTLIVSGIASALRGFPFDSGETVRAHLLTNEPQLYEIEIEDTGRDEISVPAGTFESFRLKLNINLGFLNLFRAFLPDTYLWFSSSSPHSWLRYQGLEGGRGTPEIEMRLVEMGSKLERAKAGMFGNPTQRLPVDADAGDKDSKKSSTSKNRAVRK